MATAVAAYQALISISGGSSIGEMTAAWRRWRIWYKA